MQKTVKRLAELLRCESPPNASTDGCQREQAETDAVLCCIERPFVIVVGAGSGRGAWGMECNGCLLYCIILYRRCGSPPKLDVKGAPGRLTFASSNSKEPVGLSTHSFDTTMLPPASA